MTISTPPLFRPQRAGDIGQLADVSSTPTIAALTYHRTRPRSPPPALAVIWIMSIVMPVAIVVIIGLPGTFPFAD
jgi:hypothetical protein